MKILDLLLGPKCADCASRIKRRQFHITDKSVPSGKAWICPPCKERRDKDERREQERQRSPEYQLTSVLPKLLNDIQSQADPSAIEQLERLSKRFDVEWQHSTIHWRTKADTEALVIPALFSAHPHVRMLAVKLLGVVGFVPSVPKLIPLLAEDSLAPGAWAAITRIRGCFEGGWGTCPRCGSTSTEEGNATGWHCTNCDLRYSPRGGRDPLAFIATGGFHGSPWHRKDMSDLLDEVLALRAGRPTSSVSIDRTRTLSERAEAIAAMRVAILSKLDD